MSLMCECTEYIQINKEICKLIMHFLKANMLITKAYKNNAYDHSHDHAMLIVLCYLEMIYKEIKSTQQNRPLMQNIITARSI